MTISTVNAYINKIQPERIIKFRDLGTYADAPIYTVDITMSNIVYKRNETNDTFRSRYCEFNKNNYLSPDNIPIEPIIMNKKLYPIT